MTGAGKTHTMFGPSKRRAASAIGNDAGIADFCVEELSKSQSGRQKPFITVSFLEIYNEQVKDLLWTSQAESLNLAILEDPAKGVVVQDLSEYEIDGLDDLRNIVKIGNERRTVAATGANQASSRSHAILIFNVVTDSEEGG